MTEKKCDHQKELLMNDSFGKFSHLISSHIFKSLYNLTFPLNVIDVLNMNINVKYLTMNFETILIPNSTENFNDAFYGYAYKVKWKILQNSVFT